MATSSASGAKGAAFKTVSSPPAVGSSNFTALRPTRRHEFCCKDKHHTFKFAMCQLNRDIGSAEGAIPDLPWQLLQAGQLRYPVNISAVIYASLYITLPTF
jgi:hypothetical protein